MSRNLIINADDLGFTLGVNLAIQKAHLQGFLTHASLVANTDFFNHALSEILPSCPKLIIGLHLNLTVGNALIEGSSFSENGKFNNTFLKLLFLRKSEKVLKELEAEIEAQIIKLKSNGVDIQHIDGNEHIHIIPSINKIVKKLAKKHSIGRIREINENWFTTLKFNFRTASFANIIKLSLLKFLSIFNQNKNEVQFYSILNTCEINAENLFNYLENTDYQSVEIMVHPSFPNREIDLKNWIPRLHGFLTSPYRTQELELCFNKKFEKYV